ncbi:MAG: M56 family metallopeptidase [Pirellulales bacterium]
MMPTTQSVLELVWTQCWQVALLALAVAILVGLSSRRRPHLAYLLWMLVVVKALTPPLWPSPTGIFSWALAEQATAVVEPPRFEFTGLQKIEPVAAAVPIDAPPQDVERASSPPAPAAVSPTIDSGQMLGSVLLGVWGAGTVLLAGYTLARWLLLVRMLRRTRVPVEPALCEQFSAIARTIGLRRHARLVVTSAPLGPAAYGWWPGTVILPESLVAAKSPAALAPILAHELVHLRRFDTLAGSLQLAAQLAWWFHPAVWWANRRARVERERACDEEVLANLSYPATDYARMLVEILAWRNQLPTALPWPAMRSRDVTKRRLDHILHCRRAFRRRASWAAWAVALAIAIVTLPGAALQLAAEAQNASAKRNDSNEVIPTNRDDPQPAAEQADFARQQQFISELERLGIKVQRQGYSFPHPRWMLQITLPPSWQPADEPLPLDRLESDASVLVGGMSPEAPPDEGRLRAQLLALKLLPPSATLSVRYTVDNVAALEALKQLPTLERLAVGPFVDSAKLDQATQPLPAAFGLETFTKLRTLSIVAAPSDLARIAALTNLESIIVGGEFPGAELDHLASLTKLREFSLYGGPTDPAAHISLACLDGMTSLKTLVCTDRCRIDDAAARHIGASPSLRSLTLHLDHLTDAGLQQLARAKELRSLTVVDNANTGRITPAGLARLGGLRKLQTLQFTTWALPDQTPLTITDEAVAGWSTLDGLRSLRVQPCQLSDAALRVVGQLSHLEALELIGSNNITDAGLKPLSALDNLQALVIHTSQLNGPGLEALSRLRHLQLLAVPDAPIDDRGPNIIAQMSGLKALDLAHTAISDKGLQSLRDKLPRLELLNLAGTKTTDQGLSILLNFPKLQQINAIDTGMSIALLKRLIAADEQMRVWVLDSDTAQSQGNRFQSRWQAIGVDTLGELTSRLWELTSAGETKHDDTDIDKQSSTIGGTFQPAEAATTVLALNAAETAEQPPEPTAEQQAAIAEFKRLGFDVSFYVDANGKLKFAGRFAKDFHAMDEPLPLEKLPVLESINLGRSDGTVNTLASQLSALENLSAQTTLHLDLRRQDGVAFDRLASIPGLARLTLTGELPPLEPAGRTLRLEQLGNLQHLTCFVTNSSDVPGELGGSTRLEQLTLNGNHTDAQLTPLSTVPSLKSLSLAGSLSEPLDLSWIGPLTNLEVLHVGQPISDLAMQHIERMPTLTGLLIDSTFLTDSGIKRIGRLQRLKVLYLFGQLNSKVTAEGLMTFAELPELRSLNLFASSVADDLESCTVTDAVLLKWRALSKLRILQINCCQLSSRGAAALAELRELRSLALHGSTGLTDEMPELSPQIRELSLTIPQLTDRGMARFGNLTKLRSLLLKDARGVTDAGLVELEPLAALTSLTISQANLAGSGIARLANLPRLVELRIPGCTLNDAALSELGQLKVLRTLELSDCGITDAQVNLLANLTALRELDLGNNPITDAALPSLGNLTQLRTIWLNETPTTEAGRGQLAKQLPNVALDTNTWRTGTFRADDDLLDD